MDLADLASVREGAAAVLKKVPKIDALLCNAEVAQIAKREFTVDDFESQLGINHYGHFLLINLLFDQIEQSQGRIVIVSSEGYKMGLKTIQFADMNFDHNYNPVNTYCHSKLVQMMFGYELQERIRKANKSKGICLSSWCLQNLADQRKSKQKGSNFIFHHVPITYSSVCRKRGLS